MAIRLTVQPLGGGKSTELTFDQQRIRIGRGAMCDLRLPHRAVSSVHAMILLDKDRYFLVDPGSTNGTTLGGEVLVVERRKLLRSGDVIGIAGFEIEFRAGVAMVSYHSHDRTGALARQLAQQVMVDDGLELRGTALVVQAGPRAGHRFELAAAPATMSVGRADDCDIIIDDREVSRHHLELEVTAEAVSVRDLGGKNALLVNDRPVTKHRLRDRDELLVGATRLVFDEPVEAYLRELAQWPDVETPAQAATPTPDEPEAADATPSASDARGERASQTGGTESGDAAGGETDRAGESETETGPEEGRAAGESSGLTGAAAASAPQSPADELSGDRPLLAAKRLSGGDRSPSAGTEMAILFVGAVVLAACIAALIWIFH